MTLKENSLNQDILKYEEFYLIKENNAYKIIIEELIDQILIKCKNYEIKLNNNDLSILSKSIINTIDEAYQFIINIFESNKVSIKETKINKSIKLILKIYIYNIEKDIEILLSYNKNNNLINDYTKENNEIKILKEEIKLLKEEINNLKENIIKSNEINKINCLKNTDNKDKNIINPKNIEYVYDIVNDSYSYLWIINTFSIFKSINDILYLVYSKQNKSIILYNIINNKRIKEIENAHKKDITNIRYYLDKINKRDLILSISAFDNDIKLWNIYNSNINCFLNIKNINKYCYLDSACILNDNNHNYIVTSHDNDFNCENIKIFDFNGNKIKEINNSNDTTYFIDNFYDNKLSKNYILTGNKGYIKSYDYNKNEIYKKYSSNEGCHFSIIINKSKDRIKIIESSDNGNLRIWDFHSGELLKMIKVSNEGLREICQWDKVYIFIGCDDKTIKLIELKNGNIIKELKGHNNKVITIKKIIHPKYGKCLISQGTKENTIKLWMNNSSINLFFKNKKK